MHAKIDEAQHLAEEHDGLLWDELPEDRRQAYLKKAEALAKKREAASKLKCECARCSHLQHDHHAFGMHYCFRCNCPKFISPNRSWWQKFMDWLMQECEV
jgi:Rad3-related DNA helicase